MEFQRKAIIPGLHRINSHPVRWSFHHPPGPSSISHYVTSVQQTLANYTRVKVYCAGSRANVNSCDPIIFCIIAIPELVLVTEERPASRPDPQRSADRPAPRAHLPSPIKPITRRPRSTIAGKCNSDLEERATSRRAYFYGKNALRFWNRFLRFLQQLTLTRGRTEQ